MSFGETEIVVSGYAIKSKWFRTCLIILGGCQNHSGNFLEFSEIKIGNVLELQEPVQMLFVDENH